MFRVARAMRVTSESGPLLAALLLSTSVWASEPLKNVTVSWLGNSFPGAEKWVQQDIHAMAVTPDGTVYTNVEWDEAGRNVGVYRDGDVKGGAWHTHGWGYEGGRAIAANRSICVHRTDRQQRGGRTERPGHLAAEREELDRRISAASRRYHEGRTISRGQGGQGRHARRAASWSSPRFPNTATTRSPAWPPTTAGFTSVIRPHRRSRSSMSRP